MAGAGLPDGVSLVFLALLKGLPLDSAESFMLLIVFLLVSLFRLPNKDRLFLEFSDGVDMSMAVRCLSKCAH